MEKVILSDVDGCMLFWKRSFEEWMSRHGYVKVLDDAYEIEDLYGLSKKESDKMVEYFNESIHLGYLPPLRDAIKYIRKLHEEHGFVFHCITAVGTHPRIHDLRMENLSRVFGPTAIERLVCTKSSKDKEPILKEYENSGLLWIEDKASNAVMGSNLGLKSVLINHDYNLSYVGDFMRVNTWKEIYKIAVDEDL
jgi:hypothetical protein